MSAQTAFSLHERKRLNEPRLLLPQGWLAFVCAFLVKSFAPYAAGSGISEIKCILAGFVLKDFLSFVTLAIKSLALVSHNVTKCQN